MILSSAMHCARRAGRSRRCTTALAGEMENERGNRRHLGQPSTCTWRLPGISSVWSRRVRVKTAAFCANSSLTKWGKTKQNGQKVEVPLPVFSMS